MVRVTPAEERTMRTFHSIDNINVGIYWVIMAIKNVSKVKVESTILDMSETSSQSKSDIL